MDVINEPISLVTLTEETSLRITQENIVTLNPLQTRGLFHHAFSTLALQARDARSTLERLRSLSPRIAATFVPKADTIADFVFRLVSPNPSTLASSASDQISYVALSYCWSKGAQSDLRQDRNAASEDELNTPSKSEPQALPISIILFQALLAELQSPHEGIWCDQMCIKQNDASEKAVSEGTQKTSKDTRIRTLEKDMAEAFAARDAIVKKAEGLEKKVEAMNKLHREAEARNASKLSTAEVGSRDANVLKAKLASLENENRRLKEERERRSKKSLDRTRGGDEVDDFEDGERNASEKRIRELKGEVFDLRRGVWRNRRKDLQGDDDVLPTRPSQDEDFDEIDLSGPGSRRRSSGNALSGQQQKHSGFSQVLNSGLAAFRAATTSPDSQQQKQQTRPRNDSLLEEFDDDAFDETAFAQAQREEEARKMVEHVREVKRKLREWECWRLDLVDLRRAGGSEPGFGEIFEV